VPTGPPAPPSTFEVAGVASCGNRLLRSTYTATRADLVRTAVRQAAAEAVHVLQTGELPPLAREADRIAIAPVVSPTEADKLFFMPQGRRTVTAAVRDLPSDLSSGFSPDLLPILPPSIVTARAVAERLAQLGVAPERLWSPGDRPNSLRAQALGRQLRVGYVLLARVTGVQLDTGPAEIVAAPEPADPTEARVVSTWDETAAPRPAPPPAPSGPTVETGARAEVVGALVRVADGAVLWNGRTSATMTVRSDSVTAMRRPPTDRSLARDAIHFALIDLQRLLAAYRASFER
jgi:hypothetical protein